MTNVKSILDKSMSNIMNAGGLSTSINVYSYTIASGAYDDTVTKSLTGSNTVSGLLFPAGNAQSSTEALLFQQGKILTKDYMLYTGSVNISGNLLIEIGSNTNDMYTIIPDGIQTYSVAGSVIYNKMFIRHTLTGSLY